jgi:phage terminase Nu1 subunit (DNA packaging protein)
MNKQQNHELETLQDQGTHVNREESKGDLHAWDRQHNWRLAARGKQSNMEAGSGSHERTID